jgi:hypothetical protein
MTADEKQLARDCNQISFTAASSAALVNIRNELGITYDDEQIRYLNRLETENLIFSISY